MDFLIQTDKFHQIIFKKYFFRKIVKKDQTKRNLLCYYLSLACQKYNDIDVLDDVLSQNYGAKFSVTCQTTGNISYICYTLRAVDPKYLNDESYNYEKLNNLFKDLLNPVINNDEFDLKLFKRSKSMYKSNLLFEEENDDKKSFDLLIHHYFYRTDRDFLDYGDVNKIDRITKKDLYNYYLDISKDETMELVSGDVDKKFITTNSNNFIPKYDIYFKRRYKQLEEIRDIKNTNQTYLSIVYDLKIYSNDHLLSIATSMLSYRFGGASDSLLFRIVREKYGLCYQIYSTYLSASGILVVRTIIDKKNYSKTVEAIDEAFNQLLVDFDLEKVKKFFLLRQKERLDYQNDLISEFVYNKYFKSLPTSQERIKIINEIKMSDIKKAYKKMNKTFTYLYGDIDE